jgi:ribosomal protein L23
MYTDILGVVKIDIKTRQTECYSVKDQAVNHVNFTAKMSRVGIVCLKVKTYEKCTMGIRTFSQL